MQLSNDTSKNSTSPPYLVKNERSLMNRNELKYLFASLGLTFVSGFISLLRIR